MWYIRILIFLGGFLIVCILGFVRLFMDAVSKQKEREFLIEYRNHFINCALNNNGEDYNYLFQNANKAQFLLGTNGIFTKLRLPFENGYHLHVQVLSILIRVLDGSLPEGGRWIDEAFLRAIGERDDQIEKMRKNIFNPFCDFYLGFNWIIMLPFMALSYMIFGKNKLSYGAMGKALSFLASLLQFITILSSIITIVVGWDEFTIIVKSIFK